MFKSGNKHFSFFCLQLIACSLWLLSSCTKINLYEKVVPVPAHQWQSSFKPQFTFDISDTTAPYQIYILLRHNNQYKYNNIWINLWGKAQTDTAQKLALELPLASKEGWLGTGMDDMFEHRIRVGNEASKFPFVKPAEEGFYFTKPGTYTFTVEQIMREDPLPYIWNVGLRLEKKTP